MKKSDVLELLSDMPEDVDMERLLATLYLRWKIEQAEATPEEDDIPHEEVERLSEEWSR